MIQSGLATFTVLSTRTSPESISEALGVEPTSVALAGSSLRSGAVRSAHQWDVHVDWLANTEADQTGTRALRELVDRLRPAAGRVQDLPDDCDARIWWSADSDSSQGGFVLPADLLQAVAALGVDVYATVSVDGEAGSQSDESGAAAHAPRPG